MADIFIYRSHRKGEHYSGLFNYLEFEAHRRHTPAYQTNIGNHSASNAKSISQTVKTRFAGFFSYHITKYKNERLIMKLFVGIYGFPAYYF